MAVKSISIKGLGCRLGGDAMKVVKLTPGGLRRVPEVGGLSDIAERGAGISRGHSRHGNEPVTGDKPGGDRRTHLLKARTVPRLDGRGKWK